MERKDERNHSKSIFVLLLDLLEFWDKWQLMCWSECIAAVLLILLLPMCASPNSIALETQEIQARMSDTFFSPVHLTMLKKNHRILYCFLQWQKERWDLNVEVQGNMCYCFVKCFYCPMFINYRIMETWKVYRVVFSSLIGIFEDLYCLVWW